MALQIAASRAYPALSAISSSFPLILQFEIPRLFYSTFKKKKEEKNKHRKPTTPNPRIRNVLPRSTDDSNLS